MLTKLMTLLCYATLCITYVTRLDRRRSNTDYASSTSPLLPSSTKIDDAYAHHAPTEVTGHVVRHWKQQAVFVRANYARHISDGLETFRVQTAIYKYCAVLGENKGAIPVKKSLPRAGDA